MNGSTCMRIQSLTKNVVPFPGVHDSNAGVTVPSEAVADVVRNVSAMLAHDEPRKQPSRTHPNRPSRRESRSASLRFHTMRTASTIRLTAANTTSMPWATFRYGCTALNHDEYAGLALLLNVSTPDAVASSVFRSVLSHSIVESDCVWYMCHSDFSSQLSVRVFWHACPPSSNVASSHSPCDGDSDWTVWFNAVHCALGVLLIRSRASLRW